MRRSRDHPGTAELDLPVDLLSHTGNRGLRHSSLPWPPPLSPSPPHLLRRTNEQKSPRTQDPALWLWGTAVPLHSCKLLGNVFDFSETSSRSGDDNNSFFFLLFSCTHDLWMFWGQKSNPSHSCNLCHSRGNTRSLTHWARPGIKPASSKTLCQVLNLLRSNRNSLNTLLNHLFFPVLLKYTWQIKIVCTQGAQHYNLTHMLCDMVIFIRLKCVSPRRVIR